MVDDHQIPLAALYSRLRSSPGGLSSPEASKRLKEYGPNVLEKKKRFVLLFLFLKQFTNFFAILLMVAAGLALFAHRFSSESGYFYIGIALGGVVLFNAVFAFLQEYRSQRIMEKFQHLLPLQVDVLRDGKRQRLLAAQLVPGDIIFLAEGDKVPADARLIEVNGLKVDHSSITGESEPQLRSIDNTHENILETRNVALSGTLVLSGDGKAVIFATGNATQIGKIVELTEGTTDVSTPLHKELSRFIRFISTIAIVMGLLFFLIGFALGQPLLGSLIFGIGIIVANVPEGLLPTVTLALSLASKRMAKKNALVRSLESVQTLGSTTVICTDKTGTLTENKMRVSTIFVDGKSYSTSVASPVSSLAMSLFRKSMILCNNAHYDSSVKRFLGDPTETALLDFVAPQLSVDQILKKHPRLQEFPFDSKTKRMTTVHKADQRQLVMMKGAPEVVLRSCDRLLTSGSMQRLTPGKQAIVQQQYHTMASGGERVLAFAYKENGTAPVKEKNMIFLGFVGMIDPPRKEVPEAIQKCQSAGIRVIMITGDHRLTAEALAKQIGLIGQQSSATVVTGEELEKMDEDRLRKVLKKKDLIFARTNPAEKLRIVQALQAMGEVVTVTGDGVNDAPALKNADMGVAMGISGTEVAREASDMVLMDDHFATIVNAVEEGRTIFDNIRKFITYILTSNIPEILPFIAFALLGSPLALTVVLILCIDLGTDMLPAIALGSEKPEEDVMRQKPISKKEPLLTKAMLFRAYVVMGLIQAAAGFFAFFTILMRGGWQWGQQLAASDPLYLRGVTAFFAAVVICQIANLFICRARRQPLYQLGMFSNKLIWLGIAAELTLLGMIVYLPQTHSFFGTQSLSFSELLLGLPFAVGMILLDGMRKFLLRRNVRFVQKWLSW